MIADVYVGFALLEIFSPIEWIAHECQHTKDPRPERKESVSDPGRFPSYKKGNYDPGKKNQHKDSEDYQYPECKQLEKEWFNDFQNLLLKILRKF